MPSRADPGPDRQTDRQAEQRADDRPREGADRAVATLALSGFGLGLSPVMPGTVASLATAAAFWAFPSSVLSGLALALLLLAYGIATTLRLAGEVTGPDGQGDPGWVVSDEVAGQALACVGAVLVGGWPAIVVSFVLFRALDILKPGPVGRAEKLPGGVGVLMDDLVAGGIAGAVTLAAGLLDWSQLT